MNTQNKKIIALSGVLAFTVLLIGLGTYYGHKTNKDFFNKNINTTTTRQEDDIITTVTTATTKQVEIYTISGLNKKEGDVFSLPDTVSFSISPTVEQSRITLLTQNGSILYSKTVTGTVVDETVYMEGRTQEGSEGILKLEGLISDKVVVNKEVKVVF